MVVSSLCGNKERNDASFRRITRFSMPWRATSPRAFPYNAWFARCGQWSIRDGWRGVGAPPYIWYWHSRDGGWGDHQSILHERSSARYLKFFKHMGMSSHAAKHLQPEDTNFAPTRTQRHTLSLLRPYLLSLKVYNIQSHNTRDVVDRWTESVRHSKQSPQDTFSDLVQKLASPSRLLGHCSWCWELYYSSTALFSLSETCDHLRFRYQSVVFWISCL